MMLILTIQYSSTCVAAFSEGDFPYNDLQNVIIDDLLCEYLIVIFSQVAGLFK